METGIFSCSLSSQRNGPFQEAVVHTGRWVRGYSPITRMRVVNRAVAVGKVAVVVLAAAVGGVGVAGWVGAEAGSGVVSVVVAVVGGRVRRASAVAWRPPW